VTSVLLRENILPHKSQPYLRVDTCDTDVTRGLLQPVDVVLVPPPTGTGALLTVPAVSGRPSSSWTLQATFGESSASRYGRNSLGGVLGGKWSIWFSSSFCCWWWRWSLFANKQSVSHDINRRYFQRFFEHRCRASVVDSKGGFRGKYLTATYPPPKKKSNWPPNLRNSVK